MHFERFTFSSCDNSPLTGVAQLTDRAIRQKTAATATSTMPLTTEPAAAAAEEEDEEEADETERRNEYIVLVIAFTTVTSARCELKAPGLYAVAVPALAL